MSLLVADETISSGIALACRQIGADPTGLLSEADAAIADNAHLEVCLSELSRRRAPTRLVVLVQTDLEAVAALRMGADVVHRVDTLPAVLVEQVCALVRIGRDLTEPIDYGIRLDPHNRELLWNGGRVPLGGGEFSVMLALLNHLGTVVSRVALERMLSPDAPARPGALPAHLGGLRRKLHRATKGRVSIRTVPGRGYELMPVKHEG